jgi:hypothetical protein
VILAQSTKTDKQAAWREYAGHLSQWAYKLLVNRTDAWGAYLPPHKRTAGKKSYTRKGSLNPGILRRHFMGQDIGDVVGLHSTAPDDTCRWIALDIDAHGEPDETASARNWAAALAWYNRARALGFHPLLSDSNGSGGHHLEVVFSAPIPSAVAFRLATWLCRDWESFGVDKPETFPKQPSLSGLKYGNWLRLPGRHHSRNHWSLFWSGSRWLDGSEAVEHVLAIEGDAPGLIPPDVVWWQSPEEVAEEKR